MKYIQPQQIYLYTDRRPHIKRYWYMCRYQIFKLEGQGKPVVPKMFTDRSWHTDLQFYYTGTKKSICNISTIMSKVEIIKIHSLYFRSCKEGVEKSPRWKEKGRKWKKRRA